VSEEKGIVKYHAKDGQEITLSMDIVKRHLVQGNADAVTSQEIMYFLGICKARRLNPFKRDCYLIKYGADPAAIVTSIDYFRARARAQEDCQGWRKGIIVKTKDGEIKDSHGLLLDDEELLGGFFEAKPKGWAEPFRLEVNLRGYIKHTKEGKITRFWQKENQPSQIAKVAESQGLRTLWPDQFQGIYTEGEIEAEPIDISLIAQEKTMTKAKALKERLKEAKEKEKPELVENPGPDHEHSQNLGPMCPKDPDCPASPLVCASCPERSDCQVAKKVVANA